LARSLTLKNPGDCLGRKATSGRTWQSSRPRIPRIEMFGWSVVVLVETSTCRSRRGARGRQLFCESSAMSGLAGVSHTDENARQLCRPASRDSALRRALERAPGAVLYDGRHLDRGNAAGIDVPGGRPRSGGREWFRSSGSGPGARKGVSEEIDRQRSGEPKKRRSSRPRDAKASRSSSLTRAQSGVDRTEAGGRAVKRAAAGGRMTARWSGVEPRTEWAATPPRFRARSAWRTFGRRSPKGAFYPDPSWTLRGDPRRPGGSLQRWSR
jgi:hypothetical protein